MKIIRTCAGECGATIEYSVQQELNPEYRSTFVPVFRVESGSKVAYAGGHLCEDCHALIVKALSKNRQPNLPTLRKGKASGAPGVGQVGRLSG